MSSILLTGGSGFLAAHILKALLTKGYTVVTTVRSEQKAQQIRELYPAVPKSKLDFSIVEDIACENAFDEAVIRDPPFEAVIHTASPFHYDTKDIKKDLLDPAVNGTVGILKSIQKHAPTVKRVVITSSFAAMLDPRKPKGSIYSEVSDKDFPHPKIASLMRFIAKLDWNPVTEGEALRDQRVGYRASKTFAEKAAWEFVQREKVEFQLTVLNPPMIFGPLIHHVSSLSAINTSSARFRDMISGAVRESCPPTGSFFYVDVRDLAQAHVMAMERREAANERFFVAAGAFSNKEIVQIIHDDFPEYRGKLPQKDALMPGDYDEGPRFGCNSHKAVKILGMGFQPFRVTVMDTVKSLEGIPA